MNESRVPPALWKQHREKADAPRDWTLIRTCRNQSNQINNVLNPENNTKALQHAHTRCATGKQRKRVPVSWDELGLISSDETIPKDIAQLWWPSTCRGRGDTFLAETMKTSSAVGQEWAGIIRITSDLVISWLLPFGAQQPGDRHHQRVISLLRHAPPQKAPLIDSSRSLKVNKRRWSWSTAVIDGTVTSTHLNTFRKCQMIGVLVYECTKGMRASSCQAVRGNERLMLSQALNHACKWKCCANVQKEGSRAHVCSHV